MQRGWNLSFIEWKSEDTGELKTEERNYLIYKYGHHVKKGFFQGSSGEITTKAIEAILWKHDSGLD